MGVFSFFSTAVFVLLGLLYLFIGASQVYDPSKFLYDRFGGSLAAAKLLAATKGADGETTTVLLLVARLASVFLAATGVLMVSVGFFVPPHRRLLPATFLTFMFALLFKIMDEFHLGGGLVKSAKMASELELTRMVEVALGSLFALVAFGTLAGLASPATHKPKAH
jgi:cytochrome c biogenesis protein CcdA